VVARGRRRRPLAELVPAGLAVLLLALPLMVATGRPAVAATAPVTAEPLYPTDFPDPSLLRAGGRTYAYATNGPQGNVQLIRATSADLRAWERLPDALPKLPSWAAPDWTWAPSVLARSATAYVLYYTARHAGTGRQCIGRAIGTRPEGPFVDELPQPFVCQFDRGGSIDPEPVVDVDGTPWLVFKSEGIVGREPTRIFSQRLSADGRDVAGTPTELVHTDQAWEGPITEGPAMVRAAGAYWLLYAANHWATTDYAIGYARCTSMQGPCTKDPANPLLRSTGTIAGPGSPGTTTAADGSLLLTFHAWTAG
jgi:beta-xylosidase